MSKIRITTCAALLTFGQLLLAVRSSGAPGDLDTSFAPGSGLNNTVAAVALQPDGKVLIGGFFTTVKGFVRSEIARLNADGSGDSSFDPGKGIVGTGSGGLPSLVGSIAV